MKNKLLRAAAAAVMAAVIALTASLPALAAQDEYPVREGDFTQSPRDGSIVVGIEGTFVTVDEAAKATLLSRINEIRKEACDEGVPYPGSRTKKLKSSDYVPIKWSKLIELVAAMRAAEASMCIAHQRLAKNHTSVWENNYGVMTNGENLAWNWQPATIDAILTGIEQWYGEKADWINDTPGAVTGHYTSMITPEMKYIGLAGFSNPSAKYRMTVSNQLSMYDGLDESVAGIGGSVTQKIEVDPAYVNEMSITGEDLVKTGKSTVLTARARVSVTNSSGCGPIFTGVAWKSENKAVASVDGSGVVTGISEGTAKITASLSTGQSAEFTVTVKRASANEDEALRFSAVSVSLQSDFSLNFKMDESRYADAGYNGLYCVFRMNGIDRKVTDHTSKNGVITFTFSDIAPDKLNDKVTATLFATKRGEADYEGASVSVSVCDYCYKMFDVGDGVFKTLLADILNFGAEAQKYTGYKTGELANAKLTDEQKAYGTGGGVTFRDDTNTEYRTVPAISVSWAEAGLSLADSVCIRFKFNANDVKGLYFIVTDADGNEWNYTEESIVRAGDGEGYYLYFNGLSANQMRTKVFITAYKNGTAVSNTMRYSVVSYVSQTYKTYGYNDLMVLLAAMLHYGDSAAAYANGVS